MTEIVWPKDISMYAGKAPIISASLPPTMRPRAPAIIRMNKALVAYSSVLPWSVSIGTRCTIGTAIQLQQKITATLIQAMTSISDNGKCLTSASGSSLTLSRQGDSLMRNPIGSAMIR